MKTILAISLFLVASSPVFACYSNADCESGAACVRSTGTLQPGGGLCMFVQQPRAQLDTSMYQRSNMVNAAEEIQNAQLRQLEIQRRQIELQQLQYGR